MPAGRPSDYSEAVGAEICARIAEGEALVAICAEPDMPAYRTVFQWLKAQPEFAQDYTRAKEVQTHKMAELAVRDALTAGDAALGRLAFDARRWFAGKMLPKVYGDKVQHTGDGGEGPIQLNVRIIDEGLDPAGPPAASSPGHD
jgi:hypothetical protein